MESEVTQVSTFPAPPDWSRQYSDENVASGRAMPPPPPIQGHMIIFGEECNTEEEILRSLPSQGITQLYSSTADPRQELKRLTRSLVAAFLDLVEILVRCPDAPERQEKMDHLRLLFINTHHLVNEYRPHQARETLHLMMQVQKRERVAIADRFHQHFEAAHNSLKTCLDSLPAELELRPDLLAAIDDALFGSQMTTSHSSATDVKRTIDAKDKFILRYHCKTQRSVEKPDEYSNEQSDDQFDDLDLDELDEDVSVPTGGFTGGESSGGGGGGFGLGKVVGALANADDDPYKPKMECPTCGLVLYRHNFSTHYRIHTGEMPFQCSYCEKRFRTTSALKVHTRAHTGEKPYVCPKCNYACITKRNLDRHIINNHVREGHRRGPRYRRSRYRDVDPHHEEYLMELAGQHDDLDDEDGDEDIDDEATYVIMEGGMDEVEDGSDPSAQVHKGEHGADDGSEEVLDPHTSTVVHG
uniref:Mediator of RNA polymerase II transcription subunit 7 n=1 Tax=Plectus sambesii TaxID=2011161 RepID=A0A914VZG9_9BILA